MELCVELDVRPRPGTRPQVAVLVVVVVVITIAARAGYPVPEVVISAVISAVLGAAGIQVRQLAPVLITGRGNG
jgi:hypothetical protein